MTAYRNAYARATEDPEGFWREQAAELDWYQFPEQIFAPEPSGNGSWFPDGQLNTCHLAVDRHVASGAG
ncbi:MAG: acetyl-coenzyme A synthetase N-terminal domain-containing protein, partial [Pseudomonas sp.]